MEYLNESSASSNASTTLASQMQLTTPCLPDYKDILEPGNWVMIVGPWVFLSVVLFGIVVNALVIAVFTKGPKLISRNPRLLIVNQAIIDLCGCTFATIKWATIYAPVRVPANFIGTFICHFWFSEFVIWQVILCSTLNLQIITLERFIAIVFPLVVRSATKVKIAAAGVWFYSNIHMWRVFIDATRGEGKYENCCVYNLDIQMWISKAFGLQNFALLYAFPVVNMAICYSVMIVTLRRKKSSVSNESQDKKLAASRNLIKTFLVAGIAYVLCFTINQICHLLYMFDVFNFVVKGLFYNITLLLVNINMIVDPVIYFVFMPKFRKTLMRMLWFGGGTADRNPTSTYSLGGQSGSNGPGQQPPRS